MIPQNFLLNVVQHSNTEQDLVTVLVQMVPVLLVQVHANVVLFVRDPGDAVGHGRPVTLRGSKGSLAPGLFGLATSGYRI